jgi:hypothetical protein
MPMMGHYLKAYGNDGPMTGALMHYTDVISPDALVMHKVVRCWSAIGGLGREGHIPRRH